VNDQPWAWTAAVRDLAWDEQIRLELWLADLELARVVDRWRWVQWLGLRQYGRLPSYPYQMTMARWVLPGFYWPELRKVNTLDHPFAVFAGGSTADASKLHQLAERLPSMWLDVMKIVEPQHISSDGDAPRTHVTLWHPGDAPGDVAGDAKSVETQ